METYESLKDKNLVRVTFVPGCARDIISHHTGSILAKDVDLTTPSTSATIEAIQAFFIENQENIGLEPVLSLDKLKDLLRLLKFKFPREGLLEDAVNDTIQKLVIRFTQISEKNLSKDTVQRFIDKFGVSSNEYGYRLRKLCGRDRSDEVLELLVRGCDINASDGDGQTSLHYACEQNRSNIIKLLIEFGGETLLKNTKCKYGWTPLHTACYFGNSESVKVLVDSGADLNMRENHGKTILHFAIGRGHLEIAKYLLKLGLSLSTVCDRGRTPLHEAAFNGLFEVYFALSKHETADVSIKDSLGYYASDYLNESLFSN